MANYQKLFREAVARQAANEAAAAESLYRRVLRGRPRNVPTLNNLGILLLRRGALDEAARVLTRAVALRPDFADARLNLGTVWEQLGRNADAIDCYGAALALDPAHADAQANLAGAYRAAGRHREAVECYRAAVAARPGDARALSRLADALQVEGRMDEAADCYDRALALGGGDGVRIKRTLMLPPVYRSAAEMERYRAGFLDGLDRLLAAPLTVADPLGELSSPPFYLAYQGRDDAEAQRRIARLFRRLLPARPPHPPVPAASGPRRVGLLSSWWRNHSVGSCYLGTAAALAKCGLSLTLFDARPDAGRSLSLPPGVGYVALPRNLEAARALIAACGLDVLVYTDIGMDNLGYFLALDRLAPAQCVMNGHPFTTGLPEMDFFLSFCAAAGPGFDESYSESLVLLDWSPGIFARPPLPATPPGRAALGLPAEGRLYVCPMMLFKLHPDFDAALAGILGRDRDARIVLFRDRHSDHLHETLEARFRDSLGADAARVTFLPFAAPADFAAVLMHADVVLDSFPFGGGTTSLIALAAGAAMVTLEGRLARGRFTAAFYRLIGVEECIAHDLDGYVALAVRLGTDHAFRQRVTAAIRANCGRLYDNPAGARSLADFIAGLDLGGAVRARA